MCISYCCWTIIFQNLRIAKKKFSFSFIRWKKLFFVVKFEFQIFLCELEENLQWGLIPCKLMGFGWNIVSSRNLNILPRKISIRNPLINGNIIKMPIEKCYLSQKIKNRIYPINKRRKTEDHRNDIWYRDIYLKIQYSDIDIPVKLFAVYFICNFLFVIMSFLP